MAIRSFTSKSAFLAAKATLVGDSGNDTLSFSTSAAAIQLTDADFLGMNKIVNATTKLEALVLSSSFGSSVRLGSNSQNVGIVRVFGGSGNDMIDASTRLFGVTLEGGGGMTPSSVPWVLTA